MNDGNIHFEARIKMRIDVGKKIDLLNMILSMNIMMKKKKCIDAWRFAHPWQWHWPEEKEGKGYPLPSVIVGFGENMEREKKIFWDVRCKKVTMLQSYVNQWKEREMFLPLPLGW